MRKNRLEEAELKLLSDESGIPVSEVRRVIHSFFDTIIKESRALPFDNEQKIFTKEKFAEYEKAWNIPYIGRIGPVYSRYLKWRGNEAKNSGQMLRSNCRAVMTQDEIEHMAEEILSGRTPSLTKKKNSELFNRVWVVGKTGKKSARQVIPKKKPEDVQD